MSAEAVSARTPLAVLPLVCEEDLAAARQRARRVAELLGFDARDQTRVATAVSEIARNALTHGRGRGGRLEFLLDAALRTLVVRVSDRGPGFADVTAVLEGRVVGAGITGARRLVDHLRIAAGADGRGAVVELEKRLPAAGTAPAADELRALAARLASEQLAEPVAALAEQNRELMRSLDELRRRQEELERLNAELEATNRGVVALHAELDQRAEDLRRASEMKSRFLSSASHEFRTPLHSILALSRLLLDRADGDLSAEQERQVTLLRRSAEALLEMVDDLLDLAKAESGRIDLRPTAFAAADLLSGLRGAMRPLLPGDGSALELVFEEPPADLPALLTDEGKVAQILRNLVSNALKFTAAGEVRVSVRAEAGGERLAFAVRDTGIGIAAPDQPRVFEEFAQIEAPLPHRPKGTGLGLSLSRRLAEMLGGEIRLESRPGSGSVFTLSIPRILPGMTEGGASKGGAEGRPRILLVDDDEAFRYALRRMLDPERHEIAEAAGGAAALAALRDTATQPVAMLLDLSMPGGPDGFAVLDAVAADPSLGGMMVVVVTARPVDAALRGRLAGRVDAVLSKAALSRATLAALLPGRAESAPPRDPGREGPPRHA